MSETMNKQFRSVIEWMNPHPDTLFERWTEDGSEIKNASKLIVGPGQGCLFVYEGKVAGTFTEEGVYDLKTDNIPFWTTIKSVLYKFESHHKVGIHYFRKNDLLNMRWGTPSPITYRDPHYKFPIGLGAFGNFSFRITKPDAFFRQVVAGADHYPVKEIQKILVSRITQPISDYLANAQFGYTEIDKNRNAIARFATHECSAIFESLGFQLLDFRIEGTNFDEATQDRIGRISDMRAEAQALNELGVDYAQHQQLQALRDLAKNEGQGNLGMQIGLGTEMTKILSHTLRNNPSQQVNNPPADDPVQKLEKLKKMFDMGLISEQEYTTKKQEILSQL